jgi:hypothetical protein
MYLTGASNQSVRAVAREKGIGLLLTPDTAKGTKGYRTHIEDYAAWAADNACFNHPDSFSTPAFLDWLGSFSGPHRDTCLFAVAPDVVGDAAETIRRSLPVLSLIRQLGFPAAFVAQDGLEDLEVPWDEFDWLFLGGSTEWKLSDYAGILALEAKDYGKRVHMGRVNSLKRMRIAVEFGCDTVDGTYLAFGPDINLPKLLRWLEVLECESI